MPVVLQVANSAWGGGLERSVHLLAEGASDRGWDCTVAYWRRDPPPSRASYIRLRAGGALRRWPAELSELIHRLRPDIVNLHGSTPGSLGAIVTRLATRCPVVYSCHEMHETLPAIERAARRSTAGLAAATIVPAAALAPTLIRAGVPAGRMWIIPYGTLPAEPLAAPGERLRIMYLANLWPWKGHRVLLEALSLLDPALDVEAVLVGDGVERERLQEMTRDLGLESRVRFTGFLADPWSVADGLWAYVHPSSREALPQAILEAMMRGFPIVASAIAGVPEVVIPGRTGLLVPPDDAPALAQALGQLAADRPLRDRLASGARAHACAELGADRYVHDYYALYRRLIS